MKNLIFALSILFLASCAEKAPEVLSTPSGYKYTVEERDESGQKVLVDDIVSLNVSILNDAGEVQEEMIGSNMAILKVPAEGSKEYEASPIHSLLSSFYVGDSVVITVPLDSLPQVPPQMAGFEYITYNMKVVEAVSEADFNAKKEAMRVEGEAKLVTLSAEVNNTIDLYTAKKLDLQKTASGLEYIVHEKGDGKQVTMGDNVKVNYYGSLLNKEMFDNSFSRGQAFEFPVGQGRVIQGWDEGLQLLNVGDKATFFIPYALGYGEAGAGPKIPGKSDLVFYVEVVGS